MAARRVRAGAVEIAYEDVGAGEPPLVLVHGFTGFRQDFEGVLEDLALHGRALAPDLRGHGGSTHTGDPAGYTLDALTGDLLAFLDAVGVARCDLLGHSMGGMLALRLAVAHPERVASLVLMDTTARAVPGIDPRLIELAERLIQEDGMEALARVLRARASDDPARSRPDRRLEREWGPERFWAWRRSRVVSTDPAAYGALARAMMGAEPLVDRLGEIRCPTLVLVGAEDHDFLEPARELAAGIAGARLAVLPGGGHQPQNEARESWLRSLREHLSRAAS
jgi:pimeloyl-ACP methyl ester carboxylesterase